MNEVRYVADNHPVTTSSNGRSAADRPRCRCTGEPLRAHRRDRADHGQHHRRRHLQPADVACRLRPDQPRLDGPHHRSARSRSRCCSPRCRVACPPTAARTPTHGSAFGNKLGFANAWSYWITAWAGNAAIAVGWVLYVEEFVNNGHNRLASVLLVLVGLWIPAVDQPLRRQEHGRGPSRHHDPEVRRPGVHVDRRAVLHRNEPTSRRGTSAARGAIGGDRRRHGHRTVQLPRRRGRGGRGRARSAIPTATSPGHDLRHARHRGRLHAVADRGVRHPVDDAACRRRPRRSPTPSTPCSAAASGAT